MVLNTSVQLGDFPPMHLNTALRGYDDFNKPYSVHCRELLQSVTSGEYTKVEHQLARFWSAVAPHFKTMVWQCIEQSAAIVSNELKRFSKLLSQDSSAKLQVHQL